MPRLVILALMGILLRTPGLAAATVELPLRPPVTTVAFRAYGLGLFPLDGNFTRFEGTLTYDPQDRGRCRVHLLVEVASLVMSDASLRDELLGPEFMDARRFPALRFDGMCEGRAVNGDLTLHGVTRPFALDLDWGANVLTAMGRLRRADWGMTARPLTGGSTVRITVATAVPPVTAR
ncbi:MAG: hypothetical protein BGO51_02050 [Rhodospirillales bacterium 69-11]|nr:YceI family protein [Rhodospirillales bacterium]MBN8928819.1 YceI family protein [Rhodospirillales bacterium]OJW25381.1 MAG: hypothetical protein BGO51_02050 [Rhodospirillales bacterium 69-11]